jgi:hypothetical protein
MCFFTREHLHARASDFHHPGVAHRVHIARYLYAHCISERCSRLCMHGWLPSCNHARRSIRLCHTRAQLAFQRFLSPSSVLIEYHDYAFSGGWAATTLFDFTTASITITIVFPSKGKENTSGPLIFCFYFCHPSPVLLQWAQQPYRLVSSGRLHVGEKLASCIVTMSSQ